MKTIIFTTILIATLSLNASYQYTGKDGVLSGKPDLLPESAHLDRAVRMEKYGRVLPDEQRMNLPGITGWRHDQTIHAMDFWTSSTAKVILDKRITDVNLNEKMSVSKDGASFVVHEPVKGQPLPGQLATLLIGAGVLGGCLAARRRSWVQA